MGEPYALVCDPGIDDAVALAMLVGLDSPPDLVVAVPGNVSSEVAARNAAGLAALLGLERPVRTWDGPVQEREGLTHGTDGLGGTAGRLPQAPAGVPVGDLPPSLLMTGPLSALVAAPSVERLVWMGGALDRPGNVDGIAEFNAWCDPGAVDLALATRAGVLRVVPLDVTTQVPLGGDDLDVLASGGVVARLLADALRARPELLVHDAVAAVAWLHPDLFDWQPLGLRCESSGVLVLDDDRAPVEVALGVDAAAVRRLVLDGVQHAGGP